MCRFRVRADTVPEPLGSIFLPTTFSNYENTLVSPDISGEVTRRVRFRLPFRRTDSRFPGLG